MHKPALGERVGKFGEKLQREREMRGISLEEIAGATKIGTRALRALEEEQFEKLPGGIFNKGFVRAYARYLGIDEEQAVADYMAACGEPDAEPVLPALEAARRAQAARTEYERLPSNGDSTVFRPLVTALVLLAVVAALAAGGWRLYPRVKDRLAHRRAAYTAAPPPAGIAPVAAVAQPVPPPPATTATASPTLNPPAPAPLPVPAPEAPKPAATATPQTPAILASTPEFTVLIHAREQSWVSVKADGKVVLKDTLAAGKETSVKAKQTVVLTAGNAGGVEVSIDGKPQPSFGDDNQVRTILVTPEGIKATSRP